MYKEKELDLIEELAGLSVDELIVKEVSEISGESACRAAHWTNDIC